ncbi:MAG: electron transfer flavoprotein subunit alpha/FixB family protein, partial [Planctomycetaceae bacterium]|nr:electron transfer flavoprotein subunit alpha/FixB family protein [Planctomycetaceae bacterium]
RAQLEPLLDELKRQPRTPSTQKQPESANRFPEIWTVGDEVSEIASAIAENVVVLHKTTAEEIAEKVRCHRPAVLLWNADLWGRNTAPQVAALLETGLCADCTSLEVVNEEIELTLNMYRPALEGSIMAQVRCRTRPIMATVRIPNSGGSLVIGCGRGIANCFDKVKCFAEQYGAELCASRGLVDMRIASYEMQVGLTGKHISPDVYIAVGISGSVQHLCAVETARTIIAVNPDRGARIFDYADYGIVDAF